MRKMPCHSATLRAPNLPSQGRRGVGEYSDIHPWRCQMANKTGLGLAFGAGIGTALGVALGAAFGNIGLGISLGAAFGAAFGLVFERRSFPVRTPMRSVPAPPVPRRGRV